VVAAGAGARFGGPKQLERLGDRRVLDWSVAAARSVAEAVVLVVGPDHAPYRPEGGGGPDVVVTGGLTRSESVRAGLAAVPAEVDVVVVHDAARPLAPTCLFEAVVRAVAGGADAAVPGLPVPDTIKAVEAGWVRATVPRDGLVAVQTPQAFRADALRRAHAGGGEASDDAALVETGGGRVAVVAGEPLAFKITRPEDLVLARALLGEAG